MGLYDHFEGKQIKVFPSPYLFLNNEGEYEIGYSSGKMRYFDIGDDLPLKTLYYSFPENFTLIDFSFNNNDVFIIESGKLKDVTTLNDLSECELVLPVINKYGESMNVFDYNELIQYMDDKNDFKNKCDVLEKQYFPKGVFHAIKFNKEIYDKYSSIHDAKRKVLHEAFYDKWFPENSFEDFERFGSFLYLKDYYYKNGELDNSNACENELEIILKRSPASFIVEFEDWCGIKVTSLLQK